MAGRMEFEELSAGMELATETLASAAEVGDAIEVDPRVGRSVTKALYVLRALLRDSLPALEKVLRGDNYDEQLLGIVTNLMREADLPFHEEVDQLALEAKDLVTEFRRGKGAIKAIYSTVSPEPEELTDEFLDAWIRKLEQMQRLFTTVREEIFEEDDEVDYDLVLEWVQNARDAMETLARQESEGATKPAAAPRGPLHEVGQRGVQPQRQDPGMVITMMPKETAPYGAVVLGPFPFVQLTYDSLRVGPDGIFLANYQGGVWGFDQEAIEKASTIDGLGALVAADRHEHVFSDVLVGPAS